MSIAFRAFGTKIYVDGFPIHPIREVRIGREVEIEAFFAPEDHAQQYLMDAIITHKKVSFDLDYPGDRGSIRFAATKVYGSAILNPAHAAMFNFHFKNDPIR